MKLFTLASPHHTRWHMCCVSWEGLEMLWRLAREESRVCVPSHSVLRRPAARPRGAGALPEWHCLCEEHAHSLGVDAHTAFALLTHGRPRAGDIVHRREPVWCRFRGLRQQSSWHCPKGRLWGLYEPCSPLLGPRNPLRPCSPLLGPCSPLGHPQPCPGPWKFTSAY